MTRSMNVMAVGFALFGAVTSACAGADDDPAPAGTGGAAGAPAATGGGGTGGETPTGGDAGAAPGSPRCGDGTRAGGEACDDGNTIDDDYCSNDCATVGSCGDGVLQSNEDCDVETDGCTACTAEPGYSCTRVPPIACAMTCGDGTLDGAEDCDDGNTDPGDGCGASCRAERGYSCAGEPSACACASWVVTYDLTGTFEIADTTLGAGDGEFAIGPGSLTLRLSSDETGAAPGPGAARLLQYAMHQEFSQNVAVFGGDVQTNVDASAGPDVPACGRASGTVADATLTWDECPTASTYGTTNYAPEDTLAGPGCVRDYHSEGMVLCTSSATGCSAGRLEQNENPQDATWHQPFTPLTLDLSAAPSTVTMGRTQIPNDAPSTTWIAFTGTETSRTCEPLPTDCD